MKLQKFIFYGLKMLFFRNFAPAALGISRSTLKICTQPPRSAKSHFFKILPSLHSGVLHLTSPLANFLGERMARAIYFQLFMKKNQQISTPYPLLRPEVDGYYTYEP